MIIVGDVHGNFKTLMALLEKTPKEQKICFVGDLIDRGPNSKQVLDFVLDNYHDCVLGNHEEMMIGSRSEWLKHGGLETTASIGSPELINQYAERIKRFPNYIIYDDIIKDGRKLLVCHAGLTKDNIEECITTGFILYRVKSLPIFNYKEYFQVFGHLVNDEVEITDYYANIDTGCCFYNKRKLTALQFPEMIIYQQENIDQEFYQ